MGAAFLLALTGVGLLLLTVDEPWGTADMRHRHNLKRISEHYRRAMTTFPSVNPTEQMSQKERGRYEIVCAFGTAMSNWPFYYRQNCLPEKVAAIARRLDATDGADLKTFEGCCELLVLCDEASWQFCDYPWIEGLRDMEKEGVIPKLPVLGKRWENDPRYQADKSAK